MNDKIVDHVASQVSALIEEHGSWAEAARRAGLSSKTLRNLANKETQANPATRRLLDMATEGMGL